MDPRETLKKYLLNELDETYSMAWQNGKDGTNNREKICELTLKILLPVIDEYVESVMDRNAELMDRMTR